MQPVQLGSYPRHSGGSHTCSKHNVIINQFHSLTIKPLPSYFIQIHPDNNLSFKLSFKHIISILNASIHIPSIGNNNIFFKISPNHHSISTHLYFYRHLQKSLPFNKLYKYHIDLFYIFHSHILFFKVI